MPRYPLVVVSVALLLGAGSANASGPFNTPPGVAERAAADAVVAGQGSLSSAWHNPATLVDAQTRVEFEWQQGADRDADGTIGTDRNAWLAGASFVNRDKHYGAAAIGIAGYTPRTMKLWVRRSGEADSAFGRVNVTTQEFNVPYAVEFDELGLSLGVTGGLVAVDPSGSDLRVESASGGVAEAEFSDDLEIGFNGALGFRQKLDWGDGPWQAALGGVYRLPALGGAELDISDKGADLLLPDPPSGYDLGGRVTREFGDGRAASFALQFGGTDWGDSGDVSRSAFGFSYRHPFDEFAGFTGGTLVWRAGFNRTDADPAESWMDWPDTESLTGGIAVEFDSGSHLDLAFESRDEERDEFDDDSALFAGIAIGIGF